MAKDGSGERPFSGYEYHVRKRAILTPLGVAVLVAAFGVSSFFMLLPPIQSSDAAILAHLLDWFIHFETREFIQYNFSESHVGASFSLISMVIIGVVILRASHKDNEAFMSAYPYMDLSFTPQEIREARRRQYVTIGIGIGVIVGAIVIDLCFHASKMPKLGNGIGFCVAAVGAWLIVHAILSDRVTQGVLYNYEALQRTSLYRIEQYYKGPERDVVLEGKRHAMHIQTANEIIILIGALGSLALYFMPTLETPWWWVPIAVAFAITGITLQYGVRWLLNRIREHEDLQALTNRIIHGREDDADAAQIGGDHSKFEAMVDQVAEGVAAAEEARPEPIVADDGPDDPTANQILNGDRL